MKVPLVIQKVRDPDGIDRLRAFISIQDAIRYPPTNKQLIEIQNEYVVFVEDCKKQLKKIRSSRKYMADSKLQWSIANRICSHIKNIENNGYIFANVSEALSRDIAISKSQLNCLLKFRKYYLTLGLLHKEINWSKYREMLDISSDYIREKCEEKILNGEIKNEREIREFKKLHRGVNLNYSISISASIEEDRSELV